MSKKIIFIFFIFFVLAGLSSVSAKNFNINNSGGSLFVNGSSGNVGIGTTSPNAKLEINVSSGTALNVQGGDIIIDLSD